MRILFIATYAGTSGASLSLVSLINHLKEKGVVPLVIIPKRGPLEKLLKDNDIPYERIRLFNWITPTGKCNNKKEKAKWKLKQIINLLQELRILRIINKNKINILHINAITASWGYNAAKKSNIPIIWHIREFLEEDLNKKFWNKKKSLKYLNNANYVIAISESVKRKYSRLITNNNLVRVYNGIDREMYSIKNKIFQNSPIILTLAGRIVPSKGHKEVVYAVKYLIDNKQADVKVQFVGDEGDKDFIVYIKNLIKDLKLDEYIDFLGHRKDMHNIWSETDIALVSSKAEAFGRVTVEAMMSGTLVIGANTEGTAEIISKKYGLIYEQGDYLSLAEKIEHAINNKDKMKQIASHSQEYAREVFTANLNAKNIYEVYKNVLY